MPATRDTIQGKPTPKEYRFAKEYVINGGNGTKAAKAVYGPTTENTYAQIASENISKKRVNEAIARIMSEVDIDKVGEREIASAIADIALDQYGKPQDKLKGLELLAKWKAMLTEKSQVETSEREYRAGDLGKVGTNDLLSELTERLKLSNQGIDTSKPKAKLDEKPITEHKT